MHCTVVLFCIVEEWKKLFLKTQPQGTSNHFEEYRGKIESNYRNACFQKNAFKFVIFAISRDILKIFPRKNLTMGLFSRRYIGTSQILKLCNKIIGWATNSFQKTLGSFIFLLIRRQYSEYVSESKIPTLEV